MPSTTSRLETLPDAAALLHLFSTAQGKCLVGLMSDAAYVLFSELARDAGVVQMFEGRHMVAADGSSGNHALHPVPGFQGAAQSLAAALVPGHAGFVITEAPLGGSGRALRGVDWSLLGFASYRLAGAAPQDEIWLHLSGLGIGQGCDALGVDPDQAEAVRCWRTIAPSAGGASQGWEQTLAGLAAGSVGNSAPCINQAFIRQLSAASSWRKKGDGSIWPIFFLRLPSMLANRGLPVCPRMAAC